MIDIDFTADALAMARTAQESGRSEALTRITRAACDLVPGADFASVTVRYLDGRCETLAPTDPLTTRADDVQYVFEEGPCFHVAKDLAPLLSQDLRHDPRWPQYGRRVAMLGLRSLLATEVFDNGLSRGVMTVYSSRTGMLGGQRLLAARFASQAAAVLGFGRAMESLNDVLATRTVIGQAVGVAMGRHDLNEDDAFEFLIRLSHLKRLTLLDVATQLVSEVNYRQAS